MYGRRHGFRIHTPEDIGDTGGLELPITEEDVTITMMIETDFPDRDKSLAFTELSRRTGVNIKTMEIPASNLKEKQGYWFHQVIFLISWLVLPLISEKLMIWECKEHLLQ